jgi:hypothetical protein
LLTISMLTIFLILFLFLIAIYRSKFYTGEGKERLLLFLIEIKCARISLTVHNIKVEGTPYIVSVIYYALIR